MGKLMTNEEFLQKLKDLGRKDLIPLEEYKGRKVKIKFQCKNPECQYEWEVTPGSILSGSGCPKCAIERNRGIPRKLKTHEQFMKEFEEKGNKNVKIIGKYQNTKTPIECECLSNPAHPHWFAIPYNLLGESGCPSCSRNCFTEEESIGNKRPDLIKYFEDKKEAFKVTCNSLKKVSLICPDCGVYKQMNAADLTRRGFSCQVCGDKVSFPNKFIRNFLLDPSISSQISYMKFEKLIPNSKQQKLDAYIIIDNIKIGIEMQGPQHQENSRSWRGQTVEITRKRDEIKRKILKEDGIIEIEIDAYESDFYLLQNNVINSDLSKYLDLSKVNWIEVFSRTSENLVKNVSDLYNKNYIVEEIIKELDIQYNTVIRYLKRGKELGWCDYTKEVMKERTAKKKSKFIYRIYKNNKLVYESCIWSSIRRFLKENNIGDIGKYKKTTKDEMEYYGFIIKKTANPSCNK